MLENLEPKVVWKYFEEICKRYFLNAHNIFVVHRVRDAIFWGCAGRSGLVLSLFPRIPHSQPRLPPFPVAQSCTSSRFSILNTPYPNCGLAPMLPHRSKNKKRAANSESVLSSPSKCNVNVPIHPGGKNHPRLRSGGRMLSIRSAGSQMG